jgi:uncharacterized iron-regulated membrane protein
MTIWRNWARHPQRIWLRRALFQVHLWCGLAVGLYIIVISVTGSMVVFRPELYNLFWTGPRFVEMSGTRLTAAQLTAVAERAYPGYHVNQLWEDKRPNVAVEIWLMRGDSRQQRLFDPFTGADLAHSVPLGIRVVTWILELHDNLLGGQTGRKVNGVGAILLAVLCVTGAVIWWPGIRRWRRSLGVRWRAGWRRLNWDLHSALGFWTFLLVLMWAVTGIYLAFPQPFSDVVDYFQPYDESMRGPRLGDKILRWFTNLHFGRFAGWPVKVLWVALGLVPAILFITGAIMWWNRVLRPAIRPSEYPLAGEPLAARPAVSDLGASVAD